jgi:ABC-type lipoprotein export system ATPase subunit
MIKENDIVVHINDLNKIYKTGNTYLTVLDHLTLRVRRGEIVAIVGRSGSGKSTLLNLIGGLDSPTQGSILVNGTHIEKTSEESLSDFRNRHIGFIFQFHHLLAEFTVIENIMMPFLIQQFQIESAHRKALELLDLLEISEKRDAKPNSLSGGESQRVAIARALINNPGLILADEPTGNLDLKTGEIIKNVLFNIARRLGNTMIVVTHNSIIAQDADSTYRLRYGTLNPLIEDYN